MTSHSLLIGSIISQRPFQTSLIPPSVSGLPWLTVPPRAHATPETRNNSSVLRCRHLHRVQGCVPQGGRHFRPLAAGRGSPAPSVMADCCYCCCCCDGTSGLSKNSSLRTIRCHKTNACLRGSSSPVSRSDKTSMIPSHRQRDNRR